MILFAGLAAVILHGVAPAGSSQPSPGLLVGAELSLAHPETGARQQLGPVTEARLAERCTLVVRAAAGPAEQVRLRDLHYVQGDDATMVEIATRQQRARSLIFDVGAAPGRYARTVSLLTSLARRCGARLVGPPPLVMIPRR